MKSTSSALTPRKIAEFCKAWLTSIFTEGEVRLLYSCRSTCSSETSTHPTGAAGSTCSRCPPCSTSMSIASCAHRATLQLYLTPWHARFRMRPCVRPAPEADQHVYAQRASP